MAVKFTQAIRYEGNNVHYYPIFDFIPTGMEEDIIEDMNTSDLTYDGGDASGDWN